MDSKDAQYLKDVEDFLAVNWIARSDDARKDLAALCTWTQDIALNPQVSKAAQALIDRGAAEERAKWYKKRLPTVIV